ncbi:hypothetical protein [Paenibacillus glufosinatiresistens]|uniref:hypothetical protein n=1 Tax=Paenibacillus glufosinatiresistens TaxID=3070657 RepID=UPI00286DFE57|nr:hypothetical protein [Paenibacillus sp. YX.27]
MDWSVLMFLHMIGTLAVGFYLVLPFVLGRTEKLSASAREGTMNVVGSLNRLAQYGLGIQLLTGGYLMAKGDDYSLAWKIIVPVLLLAMFAVGGMMAKPLRLAAAGFRDNGNVAAETGKVKTLSALLAVLLLVMVFLMVFNDIF